MIGAKENNNAGKVSGNWPGKFSLRGEFGLRSEGEKVSRILGYLEGEFSMQREEQV